MLRKTRRSYGEAAILYITHAFKCVRLQVNNTGFEMPIYI